MPVPPLLGCDRDCDTIQGETPAIAIIAAILPMADRLEGIAVNATFERFIIISIVSRIEPRAGHRRSVGALGSPGIEVSMS
ncbi:hypothetical protein JQ604_25545 [Bradyrhizobium jicamae]|uniref:hypothetical protein n=1 Tax=Bradyrhizobium jicamae TaxID=280332 RepID=UPI001BAAE8D4|nr:hypothetical protein [Bradyrhizobium jicamae]MBR0755559.1 hypothetical protein [Bradyrhizobium jicamae]